MLRPKYPQFWSGLTSAFSPGLTGPSGFTAKDLSNYGKDGTFIGLGLDWSNVDWIQWNGKWAWIFKQEIPAYIDCGIRGIFSDRKRFSLSLWGQRQSTTARFGPLISESEFGNEVNRTEFQIWSDAYVYFTQGSGVYSYFYHPESTGATEIHHYFVNFDGDEASVDRIKMYVDGVKQSLTASGAVPTIAPSSPYPYVIGRLMASGTSTDGYMDDVLTWDHPKPENQIQQIYRLGRQGWAEQVRRSIFKSSLPAITLPLSFLTLHFDASDIDNTFTLYNGAGAHSGEPSDGNAIQVWDDEDDGNVDIAFIYGVEPAFRSGASALMANSCIGFDGINDWLGLYNQIGSVVKTLANVFTATDFTVVIAFYVESITASSSNVYDNHTIIGSSLGIWGLALKNDSGTLKLQGWNNSDYVEVPITTGHTHIVEFKHESGSIYLSLNGGTPVSVASADTSALTEGLLIGKGTGTALFNGRIGELATWAVSLTGSDETDALNYFQTKWPDVSGSGGGPGPHFIRRSRQLTGGMVG